MCYQAYQKQCERERALGSVSALQGDIYQCQGAETGRSANTSCHNQ